MFKIGCSFCFIQQLHISTYNVNENRKGKLKIQRQPPFSTTMDGFSTTPSLQENNFPSKFTQPMTHKRAISRGHRNEPLRAIIGIRTTTFISRCCLRMELRSDYNRPLMGGCCNGSVSRFSTSRCANKPGILFTCAQTTCSLSYLQSSLRSLFSALCASRNRSRGVSWLM